MPIYILAELLFYYNTLSYVSFLIEPFTSFLDLPNESALAILSGMLLNLYAAIAFAAPLDLTPKEWTVLAVLLGVCHSLIVETAIMKKLGIKVRYAIALRVIAGFFLGFLTTLIPESYFFQKVAGAIVASKNYLGFWDVVISSFVNSFMLSLKIIILITVIIFLMEFIKSREFIRDSKKNISKTFSIFIGVFLGITYGAGVLIKEAKHSELTDRDIFYIGTFILICHAIIEDTLLFVIFGADFTAAVVIRTVFAVILAGLMTKYLYKNRKNRFQ